VFYIYVVLCTGLEMAENLLKYSAEGHPSH